MAGILLGYASSEGQTAKVVRRIADGLWARGHDIELLDLRGPAAPGGLEPYEAVVIGGSIHLGKQQPAVVEFARRHRTALAARPGAFVQVCLSAASDDPERRIEAQGYVDEFREETGWEPDLVGVFAGALRFTEYGFLKRAMMRRVAAEATGDTDPSRDYEYTDWDAVTAFTEAFAALVEGRSPTADPAVPGAAG